MSVTSIQVHLPSLSHSFNVTLSSDSTILDLKHEISRICIGSPDTTGQRVIYRGRVLSDVEVVGQVWKPADAPHSCHLAVHPSAWTTAPPNNPAPADPSPLLHPLPSSRPQLPSSNSNAQSSDAAPSLVQPRTTHSTFSYIQYMHTNALRILARQPRLYWPENFGDLADARAFAKRGIESTGRGWPSYLNQDFPASISQQEDEGVKYASTYLDNLPYLSLLTPNATPTAIQTQAIRVLSYTFPLLCVYAPAQGQHSNPLRLNAIPPRFLAPLGLPARGGFAQFPIRPLIIPLILLTIRTTLLLYFFQPARKPLFGLMVLIWVVWEVAGAVRGALGGENGNANGGRINRAEGVGNAANGAGAGAGAAGGAAAGAGADAMPANNAAQPAVPNSQDAILNHLAQFNLANEARFVEPDSTPNLNSLPPSLSHKIKTFFILLFLTLHPAIWDRRRTALRAREGRVREGARTREARVLQHERERAEREENRRRGLEVPLADDVVETQEPLPLAPKPFWVAAYVQRVRSGDWVDD
ncbi:hypothetical protein K439DRAFT_1644166 [Ramaria rubella]|nr:hypothetical protein K439DRAFT_1644166 [Ramaria rubella]